MKKSAKIYVAGNTGLVGSAIIRKLKSEGFNNLVYTPYPEYDLRNQKQVEDFFAKEKLEYVFLAAAKVGGIFANSTYPAEFIYDNLMIATNIIHASYKFGVEKLLNLGSSCIYPKLAPQPLREEYLLTGLLEPTNEPYAIAKITAIKMCRYFNQQYSTNFISVMPTNLYGPKDNFNLETSHVLPALVRKIHLAKCLENNDIKAIRKDLNKYPYSTKESYSDRITDEEILGLLNNFGISQCSSVLSVVKLSLWGSGKPRREFLYVDDLADAIIFIMQNYNAIEIGEFVNIGTGKDITICDLAYLVKDIVGYQGIIDWDENTPDGTPQKLLSLDRLNKLGWSNKISLTDGIKKFYQYYIDNNA